MNILLSLLVFGVLILSHEFGHFLLAKKNGIGVVEFSVGMGPRLFSFVKGETRYSLKWIPFGGSCMMLGEDEDSEDDKAFNKKPVWARISVIAAGPIFNFLLAFVLAIIVISSVGIDKPILADVLDGFPAQEAGLQSGDSIKMLNGKNITIYREISEYLLFHPGENLEVVYERDGQSYAARIEPKYSEDHGGYMMGIQVNPRVRTGVLETLKYSAYEVKYWISYTLSTLKMLVQGQVSKDDVAGPVGVVSMVSDMVEESKPDGLFYIFLNLANFAILLSANLGVINLLPIPALDGGRLLFLFLEVIRGKPIDPEKEGMIHMIGLVLLMCLMVFIMFNDIQRIFR